ncbi:MAG: TonB family protein [Thermoanaerobaculales bacterium]
MSQIILLLDYEPRTIVRVTEALTPLGCEIVATKDVDAAVNACAKVEPRVVLITSILPRLKVEDAITQLRARAGLRNTPFIILMSGYTGDAPAVDAVRLGAQDIVGKPFSNEQLLERVRALFSKPRPEATVGSDTRAEMLEALRRGSSGAKKGGTVTSQDLFGDLIGEEGEVGVADTQRIAVKPIPVPAAATAKVSVPEPKVKATRLPSETDTAVDRALETTLADIREQPKTHRVREDTSGAAVDKLLSQTLSGLEVKMSPTAPAKPKAVKAPEPPPKPVPEPEVEQAPAAAKAGKGKALPSAGPLPGGTPFGQYELMELIATGGMAEVYKARMRGLEGFQKIVAIKRILPHLTDNDEFVTMFIDEAKLAAQLQQPNIIHIYDLGKIERSYYIAMEYIEGKDLRSILRMLEEKQARIPLGLALFIGSRIAAALDYAHRKKDLQGKAMALVHRDVSPQNVLISYEGEIKLCDFGIVKAASKASHTRAGALKGKLQYMSPEQAWGKDLDHRSDIFSLGLVLYEMLTGRKGFAGDSELSILELVRSPELVAPREIDPAIPPEVERVVLKALKEDRDNRYQTAADMLADLETILQSLRPTPGASELGVFLSDLVGRERLHAVPTTARPPATPTRPAAPPAESASRPKPAPPVRVPTTPPPAEVSELIPPPRRVPMGLIAGGAVVVLAVAAFAVFFARERRSAPGAAAVATATPATTSVPNVPAPPEAPVVAAEAGAPATSANPPALAPTPRTRPTQPVAAPVAAAAPVVPAPAGAVPAVRSTAVVPRPQPTPAPAAPVAPTAAEAPALPTVAPTSAPPPPTAAPTAARVEPAAEQPAVKVGDLVELGADVTPPQRVFGSPPSYPPLAERRRLGGVVIVEALVDETGSVQDVRVLRGVKPDLGLDAAAATAVRGWRFKPATKNGVRVKVRITEAISFKP